MNKVLFLSLVAALTTLLSTATAASEKKNVLFIAVDDLRPELGCYGHSHIQTPHLDSFAASALRFDRAYCQQAVCAPSRASLMSGLRPDSTGIYDLDHPLRKTLPEVLSLPEHFQKHGYTSISLGKIYHHHSDDNDRGWSEPAWHPRRVDGEWKGRGYLTPAAKARVDSGPRKGVGVGPAYEQADVDDSAYPDGKVAEKACARLRDFKTSGKPFFLAVGFVKPHLPFNAPSRYWDLYDPDGIRIPAQSTWPEGMPDFAGMSWGELRGYVGMPKSGPVDEKTTRKLIQGYYACVSYVDALVGQVLAELEAQGLAESTVVVLWGDHGWKLADYGAWCKHSNFEIDTHVPLLLRVPGAAGNGKSSQALVEFVDIFPTLAEACGLPLPSQLEGHSMLPLSRDPHRKWKPAAFSQYPRGPRMGYSIRSGDWRYTEWIEKKTGRVMGCELYDHKNGAVVDRNLAGVPQHADTVHRLSRLLNKGQGWKEWQAPQP